jgi:hypothetical protein
MLSYCRTSLPIRTQEKWSASPAIREAENREGEPMKVSMVINTNPSPQSKTRSVAETAPSAGPGAARVAESKSGVPLGAHASQMSALRFDGPASGTQADGRPIEDAGAAEASVQWARKHILSHPAFAMLAQANSNPESALALLQ